MIISRLNLRLFLGSFQVTEIRRRLMKKKRITRTQRKRMAKAEGGKFLQGTSVTSHILCVVQVETKYAAKTRGKSSVREMKNSMFKSGTSIYSVQCKGFTYGPTWLKIGRK